ncbi:YceI family protein [Sandaracinobacteroides saxicola]|uniref:Polyisoprenoid-binding protein n=1 Tax=Sandaracinobacteroides saxicola TaxID=2759707 RepID=A0A7G5IDM4_9SPHN|nr:YceI family protein [Sandaracinobacteroides saxicola]QMW21466.1 polyisoprenoid-binding protein [Sandaracinobacteroides saxicola]
MLKLVAGAVLGLALMGGAVSAAPMKLTVPSGVYGMDAAHSSLVWRVKHLGLSWYTARFAKMDGSVTLDAANPLNSKVNVTIDAASVKTEFPFPDQTDFDKKLTGEQVMNAAKFPTITFASTKLVSTGPNTGKMTGDLTFLGVTKPVTLDVTLNGAMDHPMMKVPVLGFSAKGSIKRSDFGQKMYLPAVGDTVELVIEAEFLKK